MQWKADSIYDFTFFLWIACALSEISEHMIMSPFWKCVQNTIFNASFAKRHPLKCSLKIGVRIIHRCALCTGNCNLVILPGVEVFDRLK